MTVTKLYVFVICAVFNFLPLHASSTSRSLSNPTKHVYAVHLNQINVGESTFILKDQYGNLYCSKADIEKWNVICPKKPPCTHEGVSYYCLHDFEGVKYYIDTKTSTLHLTLPGKFLVTSNVGFGSDFFVYPEKPPLGAFMNYDTLVQKSDGSSEEFRGYFSPGVFTGYGVGITDFIVQHSEGRHRQGKHHYHHHGHSQKDDVIRLNSYWRYDIPSDLQTLVVGDSYIPSGTWSGSVGFGGIQFRRNFETQPAFITFPLPSLEGESALPSVMDLYVNNALVKQSKERAGPFSIDSIPVTTGAGEMKLVTTDILGRQQQVTVSYYGAQTLLKPGLQNYAYSAGFLRKNFGRKSEDYGKFVFAGDHAVGINENFTGKTRVELVEDQQTVGAGGDFLLGQLGIFNIAGAGSSRSSKSGGMVSTGFQRQAYNEWSFGANARWASRDFVQLGQRRKRAPRMLFTSFLGKAFRNYGSLGASYVRRENRTGRDTNFLTVHYTTSITSEVSFYISGMTNIDGQNHQSIYASLSYALGDSTFATAAGRAEKHNNQGILQVTRNLPPGPGYGYNLIARNGQNESYYGSLTAQNNTATLTVAGDHYKHRDTGQVQLRGSMALMNSNIYLSRDLGQSFAVVNLPDYPDVTVYYQNQYMGKTDDDGTLLIPRLLAYQENPIRIELKDLPLDAEIQSDVVNPVPYYMSGLVVNFPIKPSAGAIMQLLLPSGEPVPIGSLVALNGEPIPIGYEGKAYITGLAEQNTLHVTSKGEEYRCEVHYQKTKDPVPDLGVIQCTK